MNCPLAAPRGAVRSRAQAPSSISSVCSIITTASAPRGMTPPVAMAVAVPGSTSTAGCDAAGDHFGIEHEPPRRAVAGAGGIGGAHRKAVDVGAVERRRIDRRDHVGREHAAERCGERQRFRRQAANDRHRRRNAAAPPRPRPLRGIAPAARRARTASRIEASACSSTFFEPAVFSLMAMALPQPAYLPQNLHCRPERRSSRRCSASEANDR